MKAFLRSCAVLSVLILSVLTYLPAYADTPVSGNITTDTTWTLAGSPYVVTGTVTVYSTSGTAPTLTIEPGVVVKFNQYTGLNIANGNYPGALYAVGTAEAPIVFTSSKATPAAGDWYGISFDNGTVDGSTKLDHVTVEYGGYNNNGNLRLYYASPTISNSLIRKSSNYGIYANNSSATIQNNALSDNTTYGIYDTSYTTVITGNTFSGNGSYPVRMGINQTESVNTYGTNGINVIEVVGGTVSQNLTMKKNDIPYLVTSTINVYVTSGTAPVLTIEPGVTLKFNQYTALNIANSNYPGALYAVGTAEAPIVFTSSKATPAAGDWYGISFDNGTVDGSTKLDRVTVEYGGYNNNGNLRLYYASPTITNSLIQKSSSYGIYAVESTATIQSNLISTNAIDGVYATGSISPALTGNTISDNTKYGVYINSQGRPSDIVSGNTFSGNGSYPVRMGINQTESVNTYGTNGINVIEVVGGTVSQNLTMKKNDVPYLVTSTITVYVTSGTAPVLTIEPGVSVKFNQNTALNIANSNYPGALYAVGTAEAPIVFTSSKATPAAGDWYGISFDNGTVDASTKLDYVTVEYGGYNNNGNLRLYYASPTITNSLIQKSSSYGIYAVESTATIQNNTISDNTTYGLYDASSTTTISGNTFSGNGSYPVRMGINQTGSVNTYGTNGNNAIEVAGGTVSQSLTMKNNGVPYVVTSSISVYVLSGTAPVLTIEPGVTVKFNQSTGITVGNSNYPGVLYAVGTAEAPIVFTSSKATPAAGDWYGIDFDNGTVDASSALEYVTVEYGDTSGNVNLYYASPIIKNSIIRRSSGYGIYAAYSSPLIQDNIISDNGTYGVYGTGSSLTISGNTISQSGTYGLYLSSGTSSITNNSIANGLYLNTSSGTVTGNTFTYSTASPIQATANLVGTIVSDNALQNISDGDTLNVLGGQVSTSGTWKNLGLIYVVTSSVSVYVLSGTAPVLTIEPGVTMKFNQSTGITVGNSNYPGALYAVGTGEAPIVFTSSKATPAAGDWYGIDFDNGTVDASSALEYVTVEYADASGNVNLYYASPSIKNSTVRKSSGYGIYAAYSSPLIQDNTISDNGTSGIYSTGSSATITGNTFSNNGSYGLYDTGSAAISGNTFSGNGSYPVRMGIMQTGKANTYGTNGTNAVEVVGGTVSQSLTMKNNGVPYVVTSGISVYVTSGTAPVLTIEPGVTVKFNLNTGITVGNSNYPGVLYAVGTAEAPIVFTSSKATPAAGDWYGIDFDNGTVDASSVLDFVTVEYADANGNVNLYYASPVIKNSVIRKSSGYGIYVAGSGANPVITGCTIDGNTHGVYATSSASPKVNANDIINNTSFGVYNTSSSPRLDATGNWWGNASGPYHSTNPSGTGDKVSDYVDFSPWRPASIKDDITPPVPPTVDPFQSPTKNATITLSGTKEANSSIVINNTTVVPVDAATTWSYTVSLKEGDNTFVISSRDASANESTKVTITVVRDIKPPVLSSSAPAASSVVNSLPSIAVTLSDSPAGVDLAASLAGASVKNASGVALDGAWAVSGSQLVFTPAGAPASAVYTVGLQPVDTLGNKGTVSFSFTLDTVPPTVQSITMNPTSPHKAEAVTFSITFNEDMQTAVQPTVTFTRGLFFTTYTLTGNWANARTWQGTYTFTSETGDGTYDLSVSAAKDKAGNTMTAHDAADLFVLDTAPPSAPGLNAVVSPTNNPNQVLTGTRESGAAILINGTQRVASGASTDWSYAYPLAQGENSLTIIARDAAGNDSTTTTASITLDSIPPVFTVNAYQNPSPTQTQTLTGTKEPNCLVKVNSVQIYGPDDASATWSYVATLTQGITNRFAFTATDAIGNVTTKTVDILYDSVPPAAIAPGVLIADGNGRGTDVTLSWTGYAETADVAYYGVYTSASSFADVSGMKAVATVNKGTKTFTVTGLSTGVPVYCAVVPVDLTGNFTSSVNAVPATPADTLAPEDVTQLRATAGYTQAQGNFITLSWTASANSAGDLTDQVLYTDSGSGYDAGTPIGTSAVNITRTGLIDATKYKFKVTVKDGLGHESSGASVEAVTRLSNPANLLATAGSTRAALSWSPVSSPYVKLYNVYRATGTTPVTDTGSMTLVKSVTATAYTDLGLTNGTTYQYAVTVVNTSGAERTDVESVSATPRSDIAGPVIDSFSLAANQAVSAPITITASAHDAESVMDKMELSVDGTVVKTQTGSSISFFWDVVSATDGNHAVLLRAWDSLGNVTEVTRQAVVSLAPPAAPAITGHTVNQTSPAYVVTVSGTAPLFTTVTLTVNGSVVGQAQTTAAGTFSIANLSLAEGTSQLAAKASHRGGDSQFSPNYAVTVDTGAPAAPQALAGLIQSGGAIRFTWTNGTGELPTGYNLYFGTGTFTAPSDAGVTRANASPIGYLYYDYLPQADGLRYYAVTAVDGAGNESAISNVVSVTSDRTAPSITALEYRYIDSNGVETYPATAAGTGTVKVGLVVSEALKETPFLSLEPANGSPLVPTLKKVDDTHYEGTITVTPVSPHGAMVYKFSAKDLAGNRGNAQGAGITLDVRGPVAAIQSPVTVLEIKAEPVLVEITLDEPAVAALVMGLTDAAGSSATLTGLASADGGIHWTGSVDVSSLSAGVATFTLTEAKDGFGNTGSTISSGKSILLYSGSVPPPAAPAGLAATSGAAGAVSLSWEKVVYSGLTNATVTYNLYRRAEADQTATKIQTGLAGSPAQDRPETDGTYYYSVSATGPGGSESQPSAEVAAVSDRTGPAAPTDLALQITGNGVSASWTASAGEAAASYRLYRSNGPITSTDGLVPVAKPTNTTAVDAAPAKAYQYYAVTAVDALGNEGPVSTSSQITFPVPPVRNLVLERIGQSAPQLAWDAPADGTISGYYLYRNGSRINETPVIDRTYADAYFATGSVTYGVSAVDSQGVESPRKDVVLPALSIGLKEGTTLRRGLLETAVIVITNGAGSAVTIDSLDIFVGDAAPSTLPGPLEVAANGQLQAEKVLATASTAPSTVAVSAVATMHPAAGTTVRIYQSSSVTVLGASTAFEIFSDPLVRGTQAKVRIKVNNTGSAQMEFLTSENNGPTSKVRVSLKDQDGNVLASGLLNQRTGSVVNVGSAAVARINPGESFTSEPVTFTVPESAPYRVTLEAVIENTYYHYGKAEQVTAPGISQVLESTIADTSYRAVATSDKTLYGPSEPVVITGRAISNQSTGSTEVLMPYVPVKIGISIKGFDRFFTVTTDQAGQFSYTYTPGVNEAGTYSLWAAHPDVTTRMTQATFTIAGLRVEPSLINWRMVKNTSAGIPVKLTNTGDVPLTSLQFTTQTSTGITAEVVNNGDTTLAAGEAQTVTLTVTADGAAPDAGYATLLATVQPQSGTGTLSGRCDVSLSLVSAIPIIATKPSFIDTGMVRGTQKIETFTLANTGADTLRNARIEGPSTSWMSLTVNNQIGEIKPGASMPIGLLLRPPDTLAQGVYDDRLVITSDNHIPYTFYLQVTVTSSAVGHAMFDVLNTFMQDVPNATVTFQHQLLPELLYTVKTGADGTAMMTDIPEGRYTYTISASNHKSSSGSFTIYPGITTTVPIGLEVTLVSVEWSVTPVVLQDRYEIVISQTFATDVPAPVLITDPPVINLPEMQPGQVFNGEFTVTNYGLIAADNIRMDFPTSFQDYDVEVLSGALPEKLSAMQKMTIQYRVTKRVTTASSQRPLTGGLFASNSELRTPNPELYHDVQGFGGSCVSSFSLGVAGDYINCPDTPQESQASTGTSHTVSVPMPCPSGSTGGYVSVGGGGSGGGGGGGQSGGGSWIGGGGGISLEAGENECGDEDPPRCEGGDCPDVCTNSVAKLGTGTYEDGIEDIEVKTNAIPISFERYYTSRWSPVGQPPRIMEMSASVGGKGGGGGGGGGMKSKFSVSVDGFVKPKEKPPLQAYGWTSPWFAKVSGGAYFDGYGKIIYFVGGGYPFASTPSAGYVYRPAPGAEQYVGERGIQLIKTAAGYQVRDKSGLRRNFTILGSDGYYHLSSIEDSRGNKALLQYDADERLISVIDATGVAALTFTYNEKGFISKVTDRDGRSVSYDVDDQGKLVSVTNIGETTPSWSYEYDQVNNYFRLLKKTDPEGFVTSVQYKPGELVVSSVTEPNGKTRSFSYNFKGYTFYYTDTRGTTTVYETTKAGKIKTVTKAGRVIMKIDYLDGRVEKVTDELGNVQLIKRNEQFEPISITDAEGNVTTIEYNQYWKVAKITDPLGNATTFDYNSFEELVAVTYPNGESERYEYDAFGNMAKRKRGTGAEESVTQYAYDSRGNVVQVTDPEGGITTVGYDQYGFANNITDARNNETTIQNDIIGRPVTVTNPLGHTKSITYDKKGNAKSYTDERNNTSAFTHDFKGRITSVTDPLGVISQYVYDGEGNLLSVKEASGTSSERSTTFAYDILNRLESITDPMGYRTRYEYLGSTGCATCGGSTSIPAKITDPLNNIALLTFNKNGRVTGIKDQLGNLTTVSYDAASRSVSRTDGNGNATRYEYDAAGRLAKRTNANGETMTFTYDSRGNVTALKDGNGNVTTFVYDRTDRKIKETRPLGQFIEYTYHPNGLLKTIEDGKGQVTTYSYDAADRVTEILYADGKYETFTYDNSGNMVTYAKDGVTGTISYDELNRKLNETVNFGSFSKGYSYTYTATGAKATFTSPEGVTHSYTYNRNNQPSTIAVGGRTITLNYDWKRVKNVTLPNGIVQAYQYNANSWITLIEATKNLNSIFKLQNGYDAVGNIITKTKGSDSLTYGYDSVYQLITATNLSLPEEAYTYDSVGNRKTSSSTAGVWSFNANNEITGYDNTAYTHDSNGNVIQTTVSGQITKYRYTAGDRLERIELPDGRVATYRYDTFGKRIFKEVAGAVTYYMYSDEGLIGEYDAAGNSRKAYGWKPGGEWGTDPLFMVENGQYYYFHNDQLGTPQKLTDSTGTVAWSAEYTAFGQAVVDPSSTIISNLRLPGQYYDDESGLHYNWQRYYDGIAGRYTQIDPIGFAAGDVNLYRYARNNPVVLMDPTGLLFGYRGKCENFLDCMNKCTKTMDLNFLGNDSLIGDLFLSNDVMQLVNAGAYAANADWGKSGKELFKLAVSQSPDWLSEWLSTSKTTNMVLSLDGWHKARLSYPPSHNVLKITQLDIPVQGFRRVTYTTFKFGTKVGKFFAKLNPLFALKTAWDLGTFGGCGLNCL